MRREPVIVIAAVVQRGDRWLVTRRLKDTHLAGYWEFPGGKCEPDEAHDACLERELAEELGVGATIGPELIVTEHAYPERTVRLHFHQCKIAGEPRALLGQEIKWATREELKTLEFPEADKTLVEMLSKDASVLRQKAEGKRHK